MLSKPKSAASYGSFVTRDEVERTLRGRSVALVGSGPGVLGNARGFVDGHDVVVRVNNWKLGPAPGRRTDVWYSFFGRSIRRSSAEAVAAGVRLCMCKCPNAQFMESAWHERNGKQRGVDFRPIYQERAGWWFCNTWVPPLEQFMQQFQMLGGHVPTTGFSALLDVLAFEPASVYMTGFDFFTSRLHNVNEAWRPGNPADPIGHVPAAEAAWLNANRNRYPITVDRALRLALQRHAGAKA